MFGVDEMNSAGLTIKTVAERTGVSVHTLRAWERRYGVPSPHRGQANRYRLYDEHDIADVLYLRHQVESGIAPAQASALLRQNQTKSTKVIATEGTQPIASLQSALLEALAKSDETTARHTIDEAFALLPPEQVALAIIEPTMRAIGKRWMRNEMTVWQEHLASNLIQQKLFVVLQSQPLLPSSAPTIAAACAPAEDHQLGLVIFALLARRQGWRVEYLGQGTPLADIADLARTSRPTAIIVSVSTVIGMAGLIPWIDSTNRPSVPLVFGGIMLNRVPSLREHLPGEYLGGDTLAAVRQLAAVKMRADYWSPSRRARQAVELLQSQRLKIAGETVVAMMNTIGAKNHRTWDATNLNFATLFLIDTLACALAFGAPDLIDEQREWLRNAMPPRSVAPQLIDQHLKIFERALHKTLTKDRARLFAPLIERMQNQTNDS